MEFYGGTIGYTQIERKQDVLENDNVAWRALVSLIQKNFDNGMPLKLAWLIIASKAQQHANRIYHSGNKM